MSVEWACGSFSRDGPVSRAHRESPIHVRRTPATRESPIHVRRTPASRRDGRLACSLGFAKLKKFVDVRYDDSFEFGVVNVAFDFFHEAVKVGGRYNLLKAFYFLEHVVEM